MQRAQKMDSIAGPNSTLLLPRKDNEAEWIMDPRPVKHSPELLAQYKCRYGSSLKIIAQGERLIAEEFTSSNPNKDWKKYQKQGKELLYCLIENMSSDEVVCAARSVIDFPNVNTLEGNKKAKTNKCDRRRVILDYVHTNESHRGQGLAAEVVRFLQRVASGENADFYVLAIEESQSYFLTKFGMILEQDSDLREEYNCFSDTLLLKCPENVTGSQDTRLHESFIGTEGEEWTTEEEESQPRSDNDESQSNSDNDESHSDDDDDLNRALKASLQTISNEGNINSTPNVTTPGATAAGNLSEDQQLEYALRLSLNESATMNFPGSSKNVKENSYVQKDTTCDENKTNPINSDVLSDQEMLEQAIALSLQTEIISTNAQTDEPPNED